ncbi:hypothetical protein V0288_00285 [Pannus brasiliensis CCIBt3594]|uniref:3-keto-disaccharide hydrolase domain-containing protein n=1 Tax=Pannus brasiliensis CCIBt3594 TaxID=1427578 RepID=A0AAW9QK70_9CHRO
MPTYRCKRCGNEITLSIKPGQCEFCGSTQFKPVGQNSSKFVTPDSEDLSDKKSPPPSPTRIARSPKTTLSDDSLISKLATPAKIPPSPPPEVPIYSSPPPRGIPPRPPSPARKAFFPKLPIALLVKFFLFLGICGLGAGGYAFWRSLFDTSEFQKTILQETFDRPRSWALTDNASFQKGGLYQRQVRRNHFGASIWMGKSFQDVDFSADATKTSGPNDIPYGLITRINTKNDQKFYYLFINGQGNFVMGKHDKDQWLHRVGWEKHEAIKTGSRRNRLRIVTKGNLVIGFVNGQQVGSFWDSDYRSGRVALFSMRGRGDRVSVYFDNVLLKERVPKKSGK